MKPNPKAGGIKQLPCLQGLQVEFDVREGERGKPLAYNVTGIGGAELPNEQWADICEPGKRRGVVVRALPGGG